jgi:beta-lactamase class A
MDPVLEATQPPTCFGFRGVFCIIGLFVVGIAIGVVATIGYFKFMATPADQSLGSHEMRGNPKGYQFINPLLECDIGQEYLGNVGSKPMRSTLRSMIADATQRGDITLASVYYRDLDNGPWIGVNEKKNFIPASLLKVPLMLYFYKKAEQDPSVLTQTIQWDGKEPEGMFQYYSPSASIEANKPYSVDELITHAITYSDNDAVLALGQQVQSPFTELFNDLNIETTSTGNDQSLDVVNYSVFFRVLFNASYLSPEMSERALSLLSKATFDKGLTARLPRDVVVAHKFGERAASDSTERQLHDCGIVYVPKHPYLLCIMTRGTDMEKLASTIADISKEVYDEVTVP